MKRHAHMVNDPFRTGPLVDAIEKIIHGGEVVIDIGTGTGILAIAAVRAGARKVYAIDCDKEALGFARRRAKEEGVSKAISFIDGLSFDLNIDEKADLIICETVGSFAFDENILATLKDAKERFLSEDGKMIPEALELWGAPLSILPKIEQPSEIASVATCDLADKPVLISRIDFSSEFADLLHTTVEFKFQLDAVVSSIALWPKAFWSRDNVTDASPLAAATHWKQGILPVEERHVAGGDRLHLELIIGPHPDDPLTLTERLWRWAD